MKPQKGKAATTAKPRIRRATLLTVAALLILAGVVVGTVLWRRSAVQTASGTVLGHLPRGVRPDQLNVLLITLDTTRWDRIGAYGDGAAATPNLDRIAGEGVLFEQAIAAAPLTLPAHSTIFTGMLPPRHGVRDNGGYVLDAKHVTLAAALKESGRQTGAFVGAFVLDGKFGLDSGFDTYFDKFDVSKRRSVSLASISRRAGQVVDNAMPWLEQQASRPFFAWLHFYDAHSPYQPPEPFLSRFRDRPYAGEIAYVDSQVGRILQWLDTRQLDRTHDRHRDWRSRREPQRARRRHARAVHLRGDHARAVHRPDTVLRDSRSARAWRRPLRGRHANGARVWWAAGRSREWTDAASFRC